VSKILDKLKQAEAQRRRVVAERTPVEAESPADERERQERARLEQEQARFASLSAGAKLAVEHARAEKSAAQLAAARAEKEQMALAVARVRAAAEADALQRAREREASEAAARLAVESRAALDAEAARLATERGEVESRAARAAQPAAGKRRPWMGMAAVMVLLLIAGFWSGRFYSEKNLTRETETESKVALRTEPESSRPPFQLRLDRDVDAFAARVKRMGSR
jgi:hypothetical protein